MLLLLWSYIALQQVQSDGPLNTYDNAALAKLPQYRQQFRRTTDGRLCAGAFVQADRTYTDCTTNLAPDGVTTGKEWCYVEVQIAKKAKTDREKWDFCRPVIDYNYVRSIAAQALKAKLGDTKRAVKSLDDDRQKISDVLDKYDEACGTEHKAIDQRLNRIEEILGHGRHALENIKSASASIDDLEAQLKNINDKIQEETQRSLLSPQNCRAIRGYEDEAEADGLHATYFPTPTFTVPTGGSRIAKSRIDPFIDFVWTRSDPIDGISYKSFSVRWEGFIKAPESGAYIISTESDCGIRVYLNEHLIIADRMPKDEFVENTDSPMPVKLLGLTGIDGIQKTDSKKLMFTAGEKYPIRVEMIHSSHLKFNTPDTAVARLLWDGPNFDEQVIPTGVLYANNIKSPLKVSGLDVSHFDLTFLYPGELAFLDRKDLFIADVPGLLEGLKTIKGKHKPKTKAVRFHVNRQTRIFILFPTDRSNPLGSGSQHLSFESNDLILSVYQSTNSQMKASKAFYFQTVSALITETSKNIELPIVQSEVPFFIALRPEQESEDACGGDVELVSHPDSFAFKKCTQSSKQSYKYACQHGLNQRNRDEPYGTWRSGSGSGVGESITVVFKQPIRITEFKFKPLNDPLTWPTEIRLTFHSGLTQSAAQRFAILYSPDLNFLSYHLDPPTTATRVNAEISRMFSNGQPTGGSFEFYGLACKTKDETKKVKTESKIQTFEITNCGATIPTIANFPTLQDGLVVAIICPVKCIASISMSPSPSNKKPKYPVYGTTIFAPQSNLCAAAMHAGICKKSKVLTACNIELHIGDALNKFKGSKQNGIVSLDAGPSEFSLTFQPLDKKDLEKKETHEKTKGKKSTMGDTRSHLIIFRGRGDTDTDELPAGSLLDDGSAKDEDKERKLGQSMISYKDYGWSRPAQPVHCSSVQIKTSLTKQSAHNPINTGGIEFPPDPQSTYCKSTAGQASSQCDSNAWTLKVAPGSLIRLTVQLGHPCKPTSGKYRYFLSANDIPIVNGVELQKGEFYWQSEDIKIEGDGKLTLTSVCKGDNSGKDLCANAHTTIMALRIESLSETDNDEDDEDDDDDEK